MAVRRNLFEALLAIGAQVTVSATEIPQRVESIFVLRNNDIGDLLVITPLFEALKRLYPKARLKAGVGDWNRSLLEANPWIDEIVPLNAPWHNNFIRPQGLFPALRYIFGSKEAQALSRERPLIGIDVLGSGYGSLLFLRAGIPYRLGVRGYAGGHTATQQQVVFNPDEHVARSALRFAELLGAVELPSIRPQIFLSASEQAEGEIRWQRVGSLSFGQGQRVVVGPGGGFAEKCWPLEYFAELSSLLAGTGRLNLLILGGERDRPAGKQLAAIHERICDLTAELSLRQTAAVVSRADLVISNSSMLMHAAAAFSRPTFVLLGNWYTSSSQHARQWAYPDTSFVLGKNADRKGIYTPVEVFEKIRTTLGRIAPA